MISITNLFQEFKKHLQIKVYCISFPKNGRTWLRIMIGKALCEKYNLDDENIFCPTALSKSAGILQSKWSHDGSANRDMRHWQDLKTNKRRYRNKKVLFLIRDPRDVVVSCYFQATKRARVYEGNISDFIRSPNFGIKKIIVFNNIWLNNIEVPKESLLIRYEEMHENPAKTLREALRFLGEEKIQEEYIQSAVDFSRFDNMKQLEKQALFDSKILKPGQTDDKESFKVRKGKVGGYFDYLSEADCHYLNDMLDKEACPKLKNFYLAR